jgi:hypothetical protein
MRWTVTVARPAQKAVAKFPVKDQVKILAAIEAMADQRHIAADIHELLEPPTAKDVLLDNLGEFRYASP